MDGENKVFAKNVTGVLSLLFVHVVEDLESFGNTYQNEVLRPIFSKPKRNQTGKTEKTKFALIFALSLSQNATYVINS